MIEKILDEKEQLDKRIAKLSFLINDEIFSKLKEHERARIVLQITHMTAYSEILRERIDAFSHCNDTRTMETNDLIRAEVSNPKQMISNQSIKKAWERFDRADHLSNIELDALIESVATGIAFLEARGESGGVLYKARINQISLLGFKRARTAKI